MREVHRSGLHPMYRYTNYYYDSSTHTIDARDPSLSGFTKADPTDGSCPEYRYGVNTFVYQGSGYLKSGLGTDIENALATTKYRACTYWDGRQWSILGVGETNQFKVTSYSYSPSDLFYNANGEERPFTESIAYRVLFESTGPGFVKHYWLGSKCVTLSLNGVIGYSVFTVDSSSITYHGICGSLNDKSAMPYETRGQTRC